MVQPIYTVELIDNAKSRELNFIDGTVTLTLGNISGLEKRGQTFLTTGAWIVCSIELPNVSKVGGPIDSLEMRIYESDKSTLVATAINSFIGASLPIFSASQHLLFAFDSVVLSDATTYFIEISRTGSISGTNYYRMGADNSDPYAGGSEWFWNGSTWNEESSGTIDINFILTSLTVDTIDITNDVKSISNINTGLNGVYGAIKQGQALLTIKNTDSDYSPLNSSSPLFNKFRLGNQIKIEVEYDSVDYDLFKGTIDNIEPKLNYDERTVDVKLLDLFSELEEKTVSVGSQSGKTASELIEILLIAAGLATSAYNIESDFEVLQNVSWNFVDLVEKLNEIVEAGQHFHFIDGDGIYQFKNNQFLSDNTPVFSYNDTTNDPGEVQQKYALSDINNFIEVEYTGSNFEPSQDLDSQALFGIRSLQFENDLIDRQDYAGFIADYILSIEKDAGNIIESDLFLMFPDVFKIDFGTVIKLTDTFHNIDNVYNVLERTFSRPSAGAETLRIKARKFVFPPDIDLVGLEPFQDDADIAIPTGTAEGLLQGFKVANDGAVISFSYKLILDLAEDILPNALIYELDGSGFPTGSILATSNGFLLSAPSFDGVALFNFPATERPELVTTKTYGVVVNFSGDMPDDITNLKVRGKTTDVYANGKPAYKPDGGAWTTLHPNEFYFKAFIKET